MTSPSTTVGVACANGPAAGAGIGMEPLGESAETTEALLTPVAFEGGRAARAELLLGHDHLHGLARTTGKVGGEDVLSITRLRLADAPAR